MAGRQRPGRASTVDPTSGVVVPIEDASGLLGSIVLTLPPGRDIRPLEHRLLSDIAEQAALALRNVRLELELAERVRQLDRHTRELAASRNRIIGAVDTERRRLESSIAVRVLPTMVRLRAEVAQAATGGARAERIEECVDLATEAVESLRELTRGIYPTNLTRSGLGSALPSQAAAMRRADAVRIDPDGRGREVPRARRGGGVLLLRGGARAPRRRGQPDPRRDAASSCVAIQRRRAWRRSTGWRSSIGSRRAEERSMFPTQTSGDALQIRLPGGVLRSRACWAPRSDHTCSRRAELSARLGDVRRRTAPGQVEVVLVVGGEQDDDRRRGDRPDLACGLDPVDARAG